jgi:hypothetical protein
VLFAILFSLIELLNMFKNGMRLFSIVGYLWLHHTPTSTDVTMEIKAYTLVQAAKLNEIK